MVVLNVVHAGAQPRQFFLMTWAEAEQLQPKLASCAITQYALLLYEHLYYHPARTRQMSDASFVFMPPYLSAEVNWPEYMVRLLVAFAKTCQQCNVAQQHEEGRLQGWETGSAFVRGDVGRICGASVVQTALSFLNSTRTRAVFVEQNPRIPQRSYLPPEYYKNPSLVWASVDTTRSYWREGLDVSMPAAYSDRMGRLRHVLSGSEFAARRYLACFKGKMTHPVRKKLIKLHDPSRKAMFFDSGRWFAKQAQQLEYDELLAHSEFAIIVRGDVGFSFRFVEAVCSGAVPVVISDNSITPFQDTIPLETYGLRLQEKDIDGLVQRLEVIDDVEIENLRTSAVRFCTAHLASVHLQFETLIKVLQNGSNTWQHSYPI